MRAGTRRDSFRKARSIPAALWQRTGAANPKPWRPRTGRPGRPEEKLTTAFGGSLTFKQTLQLLPGQAVEDGSFFKAGPPGLVDTTADQGQFARAVGVRIDGNHNANARRTARIFGGEIQTVRAGIDLKKASPLSRRLDHPLEIDFITGTLEQQASGRMSQDVEIPVIHRAQEPLRLLVRSCSGLNSPALFQVFRHDPSSQIFSRSPVCEHHSCPRPRQLA